MTDASDYSPKGVSDMEQPTLEAVIEKIRDRREAIMKGQTQPSPVRRSLFSVDDEELQSYRIEVQTDNVVKRPLPARFSRSGKEEYLAEFDMVDTDGDFIPPESLMFRPSTPTSSPIVAKTKITVRDLVTQTDPTEVSLQGSMKDANKGDAKPPLAEKKTALDLISRTSSKEGSLQEAKALPPRTSEKKAVEQVKAIHPQDEKLVDGKSSLAKVTAYHEREKPKEQVKSRPSQDEKPVDGMSSPAFDKNAIYAKAPFHWGAIAAPQFSVKGKKDTRSPPDSAKAAKGRAASKHPMERKGEDIQSMTTSIPIESMEVDAKVLPPRTAEKKFVDAEPPLSREIAEVDSAEALPEKKAADSSPPPSQKTAERDGSTPTQEGVEVPLETKAKPSPLKAKPSPLSLRFSALRKRTLSRDASLKIKGSTSIEATPSPRQANAKSVPAQVETQFVTPQTKAKSVSPQAENKQKEVKSVSPLPEKGKVAMPAAPHQQKKPSKQEKTAPPLQDKSPSNGKSSAAFDKNTIYAKPSVQWGEIETPQSSVQGEKDTSLPPALTKAASTKAKSPKHDDTQSMTTSSRESFVCEHAKPPSFPGEAVVEGILERFFDKVTCTCINDRWVSKENKEIPSYMVVEIQKIRHKAQQKKAEMEAKKQARRDKKKEKKKAKRKGAQSKKVKAMEAPSKKQKSDKAIESRTMVEATPQPPPPPPVRQPEWGEKVLEQESVCSEASQEPSLGVTVGQFLQKKFEMLEQSLTRGKAFGDDESAVAGTTSESENESYSDVEGSFVDLHVDGAILNITSVKDKVSRESAAVARRSPVSFFSPKENKPQDERVIILSEADDEDGSESLLDASDGGDSLLDDEDSEYTTELIQIDFDPSKLGKNSEGADMYLAREVLRRYAEITGISLDELIEDVVDESLASLTLDTYGFPVERDDASLLERQGSAYSV